MRRVRRAARVAREVCGACGAGSSGAGRAVHVADGAVRESVAGRYALASAMLADRALLLPAALDEAADAMHLAVIGDHFRALSAVPQDDAAAPDADEPAAGPKRRGREGVFDGFASKVPPGPARPASRVLPVRAASRVLPVRPASRVRPGSRLGAAPAECRHGRHSARSRRAVQAGGVR
jgi:hypothetical protein